MCDKCSQLEEFSRSLEQVIIQELLLTRPRPAPYWFTEMHATDGVLLPLNRLANPLPNILAHPLVACLRGHTGIEQLLLNCKISTKAVVWLNTEQPICSKRVGWRGERGIQSCELKQFTSVLIDPFRTRWSWNLFLHEGIHQLTPRHWLELIFKFIHAGLLRLLCAVGKMRYDGDRITNTGTKTVSVVKPDMKTNSDYKRPHLFMF